MKFKIGDRVIKKCNGLKGTIVEIDDNDKNYLVEYDDFTSGHNGRPFAKKEHHGFSCLWECDEDLLKGKNSIKKTVTYSDNKKTVTLKIGNETYTSKCMEVDDFDLEKGIMLCLLKSKGVKYSEIEKLCYEANEEERHNFDLGDVVEIVNVEKQYPCYASWFKETGNEKLKDKWSIDRDLRDELNLKYFRVVAKHKHPNFQDEIVYAIESITGNIYLINQYGIKKADLGGK